MSDTTSGPFRSLRRFRSDGRREFLPTPAAQPFELGGDRREARAIGNDLLQQRSPENAAMALRMKLLKMYLQGTMSAKTLVELADLITSANGEGMQDLARKLKHSKNSHRVVSKFLGIDIIKQECIMELKIPQNVHEASAELLPLDIILVPSAFTTPAFPFFGHVWRKFHMICFSQTPGQKAHAYSMITRCIRIYTSVFHSSMNSFIHSSIRSFARSFLHSHFVLLFVFSLVCSFFGPFVRSFVHTFIHLSIHPSIHSSIHQSIHPFVYPRRGG